MVRNSTISAVVRECLAWYGVAWWGVSGLVSDNVWQGCGVVAWDIKKPCGVLACVIYSLVPPQNPNEI